MAGLNFDLSQVEESSAFEPVPAGWYQAFISGSEKKDSSKNPSNSYLKLEFTLQGGKTDNRKVWTNLNLWNSNTTAAEIAQRDLKAICTSLNRGGVNDSTELHNQPLQIKLSVRKSEEYGDSNELKGYKALAVSGIAAVAGQPPASNDVGVTQPVAAADAPAPAANKPWEK